jgi:rubrerythrin
MSNSKTSINLSNAFAGESQAYQKYTFFANLCSQLGFKDVAKTFRETAAQETQHAASHFTLLHPELVVENADLLTEEQKAALVAKCLEMAIEGETYEYTTMYPEFLEEARADKDSQSAELMEEQIDESKEHADMFRESARRFDYLVSIEKHHAEQYQRIMENVLAQKTTNTVDLSSLDGKWICKKCALIYDPAQGDVDSGIAAGTKWEDIPENWECPICKSIKANFVPLREMIESQLAA